MYDSQTISAENVITHATHTTDTTSTQLTTPYLIPLNWNAVSHSRHQPYEWKTATKIITYWYLLNYCLSHLHHSCIQGATNWHLAIGNPRPRCEKWRCALRKWLPKWWCEMLSGTFWWHGKYWLSCHQTPYITITRYDVSQLALQITMHLCFWLKNQFCTIHPGKLTFEPNNGGVWFRWNSRNFSGSASPSKSPVMLPDQLTQLPKSPYKEGRGVRALKRDFLGLGPWELWPFQKLSVPK